MLVHRAPRPPPSSAGPPGTPPARPAPPHLGHVRSPHHWAGAWQRLDRSGGAGADVGFAAIWFRDGFLLPKETILAACFITDFGTVLALGTLFADFNWWLVIFIVVTAVMLWFMPIWTQLIR